MNKAKLLESISQEQIFEYILGYTPNVRLKYKSIFREDLVAGCSFWYNKEGNLKFIDPSLGINADCFETYMRINHCNFSEALKRIADEFKVESNRRRAPSTTAKPKQYTNEYKYILTKWNDNYLAYWDAFGITMDTLIHFRVNPLERLYINSKVAYNNSEEPMAFHYNLQPIHNIFACYFPFRGKIDKFKPKFIKNYLYLEGYKQFLARENKMDITVLTKSYKDVMVFHEYGLGALAYPSENRSYKERGTTIWNKMIEIGDSSKLSIISTDNDIAGDRFYNEIIKDMKNINSVRFNHYDTKDFSDYIKKYGKEQGRELLQSKIKIWQ